MTITSVNLRASRTSWLATGAAIAASGAGMAILNKIRTTRAERNHPPLGQFLEFEESDLHYLVRGEGAPIVLLHGNGSMIEDWLIAGIIDQLAATNRVIAFDRPGFGHSTRRGSRAVTPQEQATVIAKALDHLGIRDAVVVGHSFGTQVALALAIKHHQLVSKLVLLSGYYYPTARVDVPLAAGPAIPLIGSVIRHTLSPLVGRAMVPAANRAIFAPSEVTQNWKDHFPMEMALRPSQLRAVAQDGLAMFPGAAKLAKHYGDLDLPVTIVTGDGDKIADPEAQSMRLQKEIGQSKLIVLPGVGHMVQQIEPQSVVKAILGIGSTN